MNIPSAIPDICKQAALFPESVSFVNHSYGYGLLKIAYAYTLRKEFAVASIMSLITQGKL